MARPRMPAWRLKRRAEILKAMLDSGMTYKEISKKTGHSPSHLCWIFRQAAIRNGEPDIRNNRMIGGAHAEK